MTATYAIAAVFVSGVIGGLINAFLTDQGLIMPRRDRLQNGSTIWRPGFVGNLVIGGVAGFVLATLYGPLGAVELGRELAGSFRFTYGSLAGALVAGVGGARLLTQLTDKWYTEQTTENLASTLRALESSYKSEKNEH